MRKNRLFFIYIYIYIFWRCYIPTINYIVPLQCWYEFSLWRTFGCNLFSVFCVIQQIKSCILCPVSILKSCVLLTYIYLSALPAPIVNILLLQYFPHFPGQTNDKCYCQSNPPGMRVVASGIKARLSFSLLLLFWRHVHYHTSWLPVISKAKQ